MMANSSFEGSFFMSFTLMGENFKRLNTYFKQCCRKNIVINCHFLCFIYIFGNIDNSLGYLVSLGQHPKPTIIPMIVAL